MKTQFWEKTIKINATLTKLLFKPVRRGLLLCRSKLKLPKASSVAPSRLIHQGWWLLKKRLLPLLCLISFVSVLLLNSFAPAVAQLSPQPRQEIRGVWLSGNDFSVFRNRSKVQAAMSQLRQLNFNTVYPVVWNDGYTHYPSAIMQKKGYSLLLQGSRWTGCDCRHY
jgi:uncharacterized lipoprotein YddW (UPF0748 family)